MYSVVLLMALTGGGDATMARHGGGCGCEAGHGRHHGGCCGESYGCASCGSCGYAPSYGCATCGAGYAPVAGCSTCASGFCPLSGAVASNEAPATIVVSLPADAKLTIDGEATTSTSAQRVFVSPNLPMGKEFHYTLKAEIKVNGKPTVVTERVAVKAGEESRITLSAPTGVASR